METQIEETEKLGTHEIEEILEERQGPNYCSKPQYYGEGGTRQLFFVDWGIEGASKQRVWKVDKPKSKVSSPRALRHLESGCTTQNEAYRGLRGKLEGAEEHGVLGIEDFLDLRDKGLGFAYAEQYIPSESLEQRLSRGKMLLEEARPYIKQLVHAASWYYQKTGNLHRDLKPSNILIGKDEFKGKLFITDYANAANEKDTKIKADPTAGSIQVTDWRLMSTFTGKDSQYTQKSEIYSLAMDILTMLNGKTAVYANPDEGQAYDAETGESLLNTEGHIDEKLFKKAIRKSLKGMPFKARWRLGRTLKKALNGKYDSLEKFEEAINKRLAPSLLEKIITNPKKTIAGALLGASLITGATYEGVKYAEHIKQETAKEAGKRKVSANWDGDNLEIGNNLVHADISVSSKESSYPYRNGAVKAVPGEEISLSITCKMAPNEGLKDTLSLSGKAYIEGHSRETNSSSYFSVYPTEFDQAVAYEGAEGYVGGYTRLNIPKNLESGIYTLAVELYQPIAEEEIKENEWKKRHFSKVSYLNPGKTMYRKRVHLIVGNPERKAAIKGASLSYMSERFRTIDVTDEIEPFSSYSPNENRNVTFEAYMPEANYSQTVTNDLYNLRLPGNGREIGKGTLHIVTKEKEKIIGYTALPLEYKVELPEAPNLDHWYFDLPGKDFEGKMNDFMRDYRESHKAH